MCVRQCIYLRSGEGVRVRWPSDIVIYNSDPYISRSLFALLLFQFFFSKVLFVYVGRASLAVDGALAVLTWFLLNTR